MAIKIVNSYVELTNIKNLDDLKDWLASALASGFLNEKDLTDLIGRNDKALKDLKAHSVYRDNFNYATEVGDIENV